MITGVPRACGASPAAVLTVPATGGHAQLYRNRHGVSILRWPASRANPLKVEVGGGKMTWQPVQIKRRGAVGVIRRDERLLVIRRSQRVAAPGAYCFPGGAIEPGETEEAALVRELREELGVSIVPRRRLWENTTSWGVWLAWWLAELDDHTDLVPDPAEVAAAEWLTLAEMRELPGLLSSNHEFLDAIQRGEIKL
jgi:NAD+ diphosphatase